MESIRHETYNIRFNKFRDQLKELCIKFLIMEDVAGDSYKWFKNEINFLIEENFFYVCELLWLLKWIREGNIIYQSPTFDNISETVMEFLISDFNKLNYEE